MAKNNNNNINKQTIKERNLPFKSLSMVGTFTYIQNMMPIVDKVISYPVIPSINVTEIRTLRSSSLNARILGALLL